MVVAHYVIERVVWDDTLSIVADQIISTIREVVREITEVGGSKDFTHGIARALLLKE